MSNSSPHKLSKKDLGFYIRMSNKWYNLYTASTDVVGDLKNLVENSCLVFSIVIDQCLLHHGFLGYVELLIMWFIMESKALLNILSNDTF